MLNDRYPEGFKAPSSVKLVEADFYNFNPPQKYDIVLCNQVSFFSSPYKKNYRTNYN